MSDFELSSIIPGTDTAEGIKLGIAESVQTGELCIAMTIGSETAIIDYDGMTQLMDGLSITLMELAKRERVREDDSPGT